MTESLRRCRLASDRLLFAVPEDFFVAVASTLDATSLCRLDCTCSALHSTICMPCGPWHAVGARTFLGVEVVVGGTLKTFEQLQTNSFPQDWKLRFRSFCEKSVTFNEDRSYSSSVLRCRLGTDFFAHRPDSGIYIEVETVGDTDFLLFLGLRGGRDSQSSMLFTPEQGLVQTIWLEQDGSPFSSIKSTCDIMLQPLPENFCFCGKVGLYFGGGRVAFFRCLKKDRRKNALVGNSSEIGEVCDWETTGLISNPHWAEGHRLSVCLASPSGPVSRETHIARIADYPPLWPILDVSKAQMSLDD